MTRLGSEWLKEHAWKSIGGRSPSDTKTLLRAIDSTTSRHRMLPDVNPKTSVFVDGVGMTTASSGRGKLVKRVRSPRVTAAMVCVADGSGVRHHPNADPDTQSEEGMTDQTADEQARALRTVRAKETVSHRGEHQQPREHARAHAEDQRR